MRKKKLTAAAAAGFALLAAAVLTDAGDRLTNGSVVTDSDRSELTYQMPSNIVAAGSENHGTDLGTDEAEGDEALTGSAAGSDNRRQIVLSMGEEPDIIYISWKGMGESPEFLRVSGEKELLDEAETIEAISETALGGGYYRETVRICGLEAGEKYYYQIGDGNGFDSVGSFTMPDEKQRMVFLYLGDVQFNVSVQEYEDWEGMTEYIYERHPGIQFAVIGGDMVNVPREEEQWNGFLNSCGVFGSIPLMTASGNHEGVSSNNTYKKMFAVPDNGPQQEELKEDFYYFDFGVCRFIMTDSSFLTEQRKEKIGNNRWAMCEAAIEDWLHRTIEESPKTWNIVVTHHPPYGMHDKDTVSPQLRQLWAPIWEEAGADLVLCGHQHMYMRTEKINGVTYVMGNSGNRKSEFFNGSNSPVYCAATYADSANYQVIEADSRKLKLTSYNKKGLIVDEAVLRKSLFHIFKLFGGHQVIVEGTEMNEVI